jgi:hypothetical protein
VFVSVTLASPFPPAPPTGMKVIASWEVAHRPFGPGVALADGVADGEGDGDALGEVDVVACP